MAPTADVDLDRYFKDKSLVDLTERFFSGLGLETKDLLFPIEFGAEVVESSTADVAPLEAVPVGACAEAREH